MSRPNFLNDMFVTPAQRKFLLAFGNGDVNKGLHNLIHDMSELLYGGKVSGAAETHRVNEKIYAILSEFDGTTYRHDVLLREEQAFAELLQARDTMSRSMSILRMDAPSKSTEDEDDAK